MKFRALFIGLALVGGRCWAVAPDSVAGFLFSQTGNTIAHSSFSSLISLDASGSFQGVCSQTTSGTIAGGPFRLTDPQDGTWSYKKVDDSTAALTLLSSGGPQNLTLKFTADSSGFVLASSLNIGILSESFSLVPLPIRPPLCNCSNRSFVRAGSLAFTGFVVTGSGALVLVRGVGPSLALFGITDGLQNPRLNVVDASSGRVIVSNDDWGSESSLGISRAGAIVGAFPMSAGSKDSAVILSVGPGAYVAQVDSPDASDSGQALIEVYVLP